MGCISSSPQPVPPTQSHTSQLTRKGTNGSNKPQYQGIESWGDMAKVLNQQNMNLKTLSKKEVEVKPRMKDSNKSLTSLLSQPYDSKQMALKNIEIRPAKKQDKTIDEHLASLFS